MRINFHYRPNHGEMWKKIAAWYSLSESLELLGELGYSCAVNSNDKCDLTIYWDSLEYCALVKKPKSPHFVRLGGWSNYDPPDIYNSLRRADAVLCVSHRIQNYADDKWGVKTCYIPITINPKYFYPSGVGEGWCYFGTPYNAKGVDILSKSGLKVSCYGEWSSVNLGNGWLDMEFYLESNLRHGGNISHEYVGDMMRSHKYFIHLSKKEGQSGAVKEAQACGLPSVVTDTGDNLEFVTGVVLPVSPTVERVLSAVKDLESMDYDEMRRKAVESVSCFSPREIGHLWTKLLS